MEKNVGICDVSVFFKSIRLKRTLEHLGIRGVTQGLVDSVLKGME